MTENKGAFYLGWSGKTSANDIFAGILEMRE